MKVLLLGDQGQIGSNLKILLEKKKNLDLTTWNKLNINFKKINEIEKKILKIKPDIIINAIAFTNVNLSIKNKKEVMLVNYQAVKKLCLVAKKINSYFIHYSTDYVFDGKKKSFKELDVTNPLNFYGKSKAMADNFILKSMKNFLILRVSWVYSYKKNNFIMKMLSQYTSNKKNIINVVNDEYGTPNSYLFISKLTIKLINIIKKKNISGVYNISTKGLISRYDLAKFLLENMNKKYIKNNNLNSVKTNLKEKIFRPKFSNLKVNKVEKLINAKCPHWTNDVKYFLKNLNYDCI